MAQRLLLKPGSSERLAFCRILFYGCYLVQVQAYDTASYAKLPAEFWRPTLLLRLLPAPSEALFLAALYLLQLSLLFACVGLLARASAVAVAILGGFVFAVVNGYGHADFHLSPVILISWSLALAPSGDAYSVDALLRRKPAVRNPVDYFWPIQLAKVCLVALMGTAGIQKAFGSWLSDPSGAMRSFLLYKYYAQSTEKGIELSGLVLSLAECTWVLAGLAMFVLFCELACPLALIEEWPRLRFILIGGLFLMQLVLTVWLKTLPTFPWLGAYVFWVPWERLLPRVKVQP